MCFSASASFIAAGALTGIGAATQAQARGGERVIASFPLVFAAQQVAEGIVWVTLREPAAHPDPVATAIFLLVAVGLWPVLCPLAVLLLEPSRARRRILRALLLFGVALGVWLFAADMHHGVVPQEYCGNLLYDTSFLPMRTPARLSYLLVCTGSFAASSHKKVRILGALSFASALLTLVVYRAAFISVWCFFGAIMSAWVLVILRQAAPARGPVAAAAARHC